jgi:hypothetical protein
MTGLNSQGAHDTLSYRRTERGEILQDNNQYFSLPLEMTGLNSQGAHDTLSFRRTERGEILQHNNQDFSLPLEMTGLNSQGAHDSEQCYDAELRNDFLLNT